MPTSPVTASVSGGTFTVNVAACNLDPDLTIRDFLVLENGTLTVNPSSYTKATASSLQYSGPVLGTTTLEVRRNTPRAVITTVLPATKIRATDWNREFDRRVRIQEEVDLFGAGGGFTVRLPLNEAYGITWATDTLFSPTRQALYNQMETYVSSVSPAFTGNPTTPTQLTTDNSTRVASTAYVKNNLTSYATLASPALTGSPTVPTPATADSSTLVASTAYVKNNLASYVTSTSLTTTLTSYAPLASPTFTGVPVMPTFSDGVKTTQAVNALNLQRRCKPVVRLQRSSAFTTTALTTVDLPFNNELSDVDNTYSAGVFTAPFTGCYSIDALVDLGNTDLVAITFETTANVEVGRVAQARLNSSANICACGSTVVELVAGTGYKFRIYANHAANTQTGSQCRANIYYLGILTAS